MHTYVHMYIHIHIYKRTYVELLHIRQNVSMYKSIINTYVPGFESHYCVLN